MGGSGGPLGGGHDRRRHGRRAGAAAIGPPSCLSGLRHGRRLLARRDKPRDRLPDRHHVANLCEDAGQYAFSLSLHLHDRLVGFDFQEHLALRDALPFLLFPGHELPGLLGHFEGWHHDAYGHRVY